MAKADALFRDLLSSGIDPDGASFSALICGHCSAGNVEKAMDYFRFLREKGIVPTAPLFDAILDGCAWVNMPALMEQVLAEMEAAGVRPSTKTLSILMRLHGLNRDTEQALAVFNELPKKHGLTLDGRAYGTLISVCLKSDTYDLAWSTFERMSRAACMAHSRTYEALISECLRRGCLENAARVVTETLGLSEKSEEETTVSAPVRPRVRLQAKIFEDALRLIGRRRQAALLGLPLLEKLEGAEIEISQPLADAIRRSASAETRLPCSELQRRQEQLQQWRSFPKGRLQPLNEEAD
jgi:pentatricopeptide repeat protein